MLYQISSFWSITPDFNIRRVHLTLYSITQSDINILTKDENKLRLKWNGSVEFIFTHTRVCVVLPYPLQNCLAFVTDGWLVGCLPTMAINIWYFEDIHMHSLMLSMSPNGRRNLEISFKVKGKKTKKITLITQ